MAWNRSMHINCTFEDGWNKQMLLYKVVFCIPVRIRNNADRQTWAKCVDPDQSLQKAASDYDLHNATHQYFFFFKFPTSGIENGLFHFWVSTERSLVVRILWENTVHYEPQRQKRTFSHLTAKDAKFLHADNEDFDQTAWMRVTI